MDDDQWGDNLAGCRFIKVLDNDLHHPYITILFDKKDDDGELTKGLLRLFKRPFDESKAEKLLSTCKLDGSDLINPPNWTYTGEMKGDDRISVGVTYPASEWEIERASRRDLVLLRETSTMYRNVTVKHLIPNDRERLKWVDEIISGEKADRVIFRDETPGIGFILCADMRWNYRSMDRDKDVYLLLLVKDESLKTIRDLTDSHIPLLTNMKKSTEVVMEEMFKIKHNTFRFFFHYHPSFMHLHCHVNSHRMLNYGSMVDRAHLLDDVVDNLKLDGQYYQKRDITIRVSEEDAKLYSEYIQL
eukprot:GHVH01006424.1.p1 GENE.GHVH01006424.1~~GHVH01006424.1.p1  ORF type:complete len:313 (-),score=48.75 GHVH01006424.1:1703-2608(-)